MKQKLLVLSLGLSLLLNAYGAYKLAGRHFSAKTHDVYSVQIKACVDSWNNCILKSCAGAENIFIGSSSTFLAPTDSIPNSLNLGYWGDKLSGMRYRLTAFSSWHPKRVFVFPSTNGYTSQTNQQYLSDFKDLILTARKSFPDSELFVISTFPMTESRSSDTRNNGRIKIICDAIKEQEDSLGFQYIDVFTPLLNNREYLPEEETLDGMHLSPSAYKVWLEEVKKFL